WREICETARDRWKVALPLMAQDGKSGKCLSITKLSKDLHYTMKYPDLYDALEGMTSNVERLI
ncbi:MAG TPA: hypothetical protein VD738_03825, partial [Nitrospira sp.]|nr:hypothetical protein [Nitrospira sp.]